MRKSLLPLLERRRATLWYAAQFEGFELSPNIVYGGACPNQHVAPLIDYLVGEGCGHIALVGSDYIFARETNKVARRKLASAGGRVVSEAYLPLDAGDAHIAEVVANLPASTEAIVLSLVGGVGARFCRALRAAGVTAPVASVAASEIDLDGDAEAMVGLISVAPYFERLELDENRAFLRRFRRVSATGRGRAGTRSTPICR